VRYLPAKLAATAECRGRGPVRRLPLVPHHGGLLLSLLVCGGIVLLLWLTDGTAAGPPVGRWLDTWGAVWVAGVSAVWPVSAWVWKRVQQRRASPQG